MQEEVENRTLTLIVSGTKFTGRLLKAAITKYMAHLKEKKLQKQRSRDAPVTPHGKQTVKQLMRHGVSTNSLELSGDTKSFDRVARKWNVDYAFYKTGPDKYLLFFKAGQADAMTACFSEYSKRVLNKSKSRRIPIRDQIKRAGDHLTREKPKQRERVKEAVHENR